MTEMNKDVDCISIIISFLQDTLVNVAIVFLYVFILSFAFSIPPVTFGQYYTLAFILTLLKFEIH